MTESYHLPENAEASIVGCVLLCPDVKPAVSKLVSEGDFASPAYGAMFSAAMEMDEPGSVAFREAVKARGYTLPDGFFAALGTLRFPGTTWSSMPSCCGRLPSGGS